MDDNRQPLLVITLDDMNSAPKVIYQGIELDGRMEVNYHWVTKGRGLGKHSMHLKRFNKEFLCIEEVKVNRLGLGETEGETKMKDKTILMDEDKRVELLINYQRELRKMLVECNMLSQNSTDDLARRYVETCNEIERALIPPIIEDE